MALSNNTKVREAYETGEYVHTDGTLWYRGMDGWFLQGVDYIHVWPHYLFVPYIEKNFPDDA